MAGIEYAKDYVARVNLKTGRSKEQQEEKGKYKFFLENKTKGIEIKECEPDTYVEGLYYACANIYFTYTYRNKPYHFVWWNDDYIYIYYDDNYLVCSDNSFNPLKNKNKGILKNTDNIIEGLENCIKNMKKTFNKAAKLDVEKAKKRWDFFTNKIKSKEIELSNEDPSSNVSDRELLRRENIFFKYEGKNWLWFKDYWIYLQKDDDSFNTKKSEKKPKNSVRNYEDDGGWYCFNTKDLNAGQILKELKQVLSDYKTDQENAKKRR